MILQGPEGEHRILEILIDRPTLPSEGETILVPGFPKGKAIKGRAKGGDAEVFMEGRNSHPEDGRVPPLVILEEELCSSRREYDDEFERLTKECGWVGDELRRRTPKS